MLLFLVVYKLLLYNTFLQHPTINLCSLSSRQPHWSILLPVVCMCHRVKVMCILFHSCYLFLMIWFILLFIVFATNEFYLLCCVMIHVLQHHYHLPSCLILSVSMLRFKVMNDSLHVHVLYYVCFLYHCFLLLLLLSYCYRHTSCFPSSK